MIGAHPDDIEATCGGTIKLLREREIDVYYTITTNGDKGCSNSTFCSGLSVDEIAVARRYEQYNAAKILNIPIENINLLNYEDGLLISYAPLEVRKRLAADIRRRKADVVMSWSPYPNLSLAPYQGWLDLGYHTDHQETGRLALYASRTAGSTRLFPELGVPHRPSFYFIWEYLEPDFYLDITDAVPFKVASYAAHTSQGAYDGQSKEMWTEIGERIASSIPGFKGQYAEGFKAYY